MGVAGLLLNYVVQIADVSFQQGVIRGNLTIRLTNYSNRRLLSSEIFFSGTLSCRKHKAPDLVNGGGEITRTRPNDRWSAWTS